MAATMHLSRRRAALLAFPTVVAVAVAGAVALRQPRQYAAQTTVFVGRVLPATRADVDSSISDFETVIRLPDVVRAVAQQTGVASRTISRGVKFARVVGSSAVMVSFHGQDAKRAAAVVTAASHAALVTLAQQQVDGANERVAAAQAAADTARSAITSINQRLGVADLQVQYLADQQDLLNLDNQVVSAPSGHVATLNSLIALRTQELDRLARGLPEYEQQSDKLTEATSALGTATQALTDARGKLDAAGSPTIVTLPKVTKQSRLVRLARAFVVTAVTVILLGLVLFIVVDWLRRAPGAGSSGVDHGSSVVRGAHPADGAAAPSRPRAGATVGDR
jgi:hypothetical protein